MANLPILLSPQFRATVKKLYDTDVARIEEALRILPECFGQPHRHAGISIRRMRQNIFECRAGLKVRLLFRVTPKGLEIFFAGNHDEVRRVIRHL